MTKRQRLDAARDNKNTETGKRLRGKQGISGLMDEFHRLRETGVELKKIFLSREDEEKQKREAEEKKWAWVDEMQSLPSRAQWAKIYDLFFPSK